MTPVNAPTASPSLNLGVIGNCAFSALIDAQGGVVWCCLPRYDSNPVFHALLSDGSQGASGRFAIDVEDFDHAEQAYEPNTAILRTRLFDTRGRGLEITDFAPRFEARGRLFRPLTMIRRLRPINGSPRIRVRLRPTQDWGTRATDITHGSNHIRFVGDQYTMRFTTSAPIDYVLKETAFLLDKPIAMILGPDETLTDGVEQTAADFQEKTASYWRHWTRRLALPLEWQDAVIRSAITLKLCVFEETGAIVAALTTSIPESAGSGRNWDYRFCWLRDAFFVVRALNTLSEVATMEDYLRWLRNVVVDADGGHMQPVYGIGLEAQISERIIEGIPGYRGMGPVRAGNQAHEHFQYDVFGNVVLGAAQAFFDRRLLRPADDDDFERLEKVGEQAFHFYDKPDAGMWELRTRARVHTSSALMCWAACDRLAKIAREIRRAERADVWAERASLIRDRILDEAWSEERQAFAESFGGRDLDASVLLMAEVGLIDPMDPRFVATVERLEEALTDGPYMLRYEADDDFGAPEVSFNICAFWRIEALARVGQMEKARETFEAMLALRNPLGLLSEDTHPATGELWGNFPQTYSMVGIINCARLLSTGWETRI
ncbi:MAG: glycoside hydrolase family 15 protein [Minwuia sp.]|nr:glycoside hydrolase family 15 protein [Minwuia sp.]